jgi:uncharacterized delta-60 repeat protein
MKRKSQRPAVLPLIAVCIALADCSGSTNTSSTVFPTAIAVRQYTSTGALDTGNFGAGTGAVITDFEPGLNDYALANKLQGTNILVAGSVGKTLPNGTPQAQVALLRYTSTGALDNTFGTSGAVRTPIGNANAEAVAIDIQADGNIVVAATILSSSFSSVGIALLRYNGTSGLLDTSFGGGIVTASIGTSADTAAAAVVVQADQKIVVAGHAQMVSGRTDIVLLRYNPNGTLDTTFGPAQTGIVTTELSGDSVALAMVLQPDNKLVVAGSLGGGASPLDTVLVRYNPDGSLDTTGFGAPNGFVTTDAGGDDFANSVVLQPADNKIVVAGHANVNLMNDTSDFAVLRYTSTGALDPTFGATGIVITDLGAFDNAFSVALQNDGKIVVSGNTGSAGGNVSVAIARYTAAGVLDGSFGTNGFVTSPPIGPSFITSGNSIVLQPTTGAIIAAGFD